MTQFARLLPQLLQRTDVVLELRDARLPLTSINRTFEGKHRLRAWPSRFFEGASARAPAWLLRGCESYLTRDGLPDVFTSFRKMCYA